MMIDSPLQTQEASWKEDAIIQGRIVELDSAADAYDLSLNYEEEVGAEKFHQIEDGQLRDQARCDAGGQSTVELDEAEEYETSGGISLALCRPAVWPLPCAPPRFSGRPLCEQADAVLLQGAFCWRPVGCFFQCLRASCGLGSCLASLSVWLS